jgi:hypothetical protein
MRRSGERGSAMVVVMVILVALLGAGAVAIYVQVADTRSTGMIRSARDALYCAEAGLATARPLVGQNFADWPILLDDDPDNDDGAGWYPVEGDLDGDGDIDYEVRIMDNDDESPPQPNDTTRDNDLRVFIVSKCVKFPDTPREVLELVLYQGGGTLYRNQAGQGSSNTGNAN